MTHIPAALRSKLALRPVEDVRFTETGDDPDRYRDAIRFGNGKVMVLQALPERVCFMVLSLGSDEDFTRLRIPILPDRVAPLAGQRR